MRWHKVLWNFLMVDVWSSLKVSHHLMLQSSRNEHSWVKILERGLEKDLPYLSVYKATRRVTLPPNIPTQNVEFVTVYTCCIRLPPLPHAWFCFGCIMGRVSFAPFGSFLERARVCWKKEQQRGGSHFERQQPCSRISKWLPPLCCSDSQLFSAKVRLFPG